MTDTGSGPAGSRWDIAGMQSAGEEAMAGLLHAAHLASPHELPQLIAEHAAVLGVRDALVYLVDLQQRVLVPFLGSRGPAPEQHVDRLLVDGTLAGRAFQLSQVQVQLHGNGGADGVRAWFPLLDGTARLGVLAVTVDDPAELERHGGLLTVRLMRYATLVAELVMTKTLYGDAIVRTQRRAEMGVAAEIQWAVLPPLTFACQQVVVAAALEPAYEVAGDSVDYAVDADLGRFAVFDGMGHGLHSAQLAATTVAAYRNARRTNRSLTATAALLDGVATEVVGSREGAEGFITGVVAELALETGVLSWVNAGHPPPLLLREGHLVKTLQTPPALPFGLSLGAVTPAPIAEGGGAYHVGTEHLQPGDRVIFYTDGITEARSPAGELFGIERLVDLLIRTHAAALPAPETLRRVVHALLAHQQNQLTDDATLLLVEWHGGGQRQLLPQAAL
jgi:serine phosphatase RsbU (regulator of sigma subunit)